MLGQSCWHRNTLICNRISALVMLWTFVTSVLISHYLAGFESVLIAPVQQASIQTFKELVQADYRILVKNGTRTYYMLYYEKYNSFDSLPHLKKLKETADIVENNEFLMHMTLVEKP